MIVGQVLFYTWWGGAQIFSKTMCLVFNKIFPTHRTQEGGEHSLRLASSWREWWQALSWSGGDLSVGSMAWSWHCWDLLRFSSPKNGQFSSPRMLPMAATLEKSNLQACSSKTHPTQTDLVSLQRIKQMKPPYEPFINIMAPSHNLLKVLLKSHRLHLTFKRKKKGLLVK